MKHFPGRIESGQTPQLCRSLTDQQLGQQSCI